MSQNVETVDGGKAFLNTKRLCVESFPHEHGDTRNNMKNEGVG